MEPVEPRMAMRWFNGEGVYEKGGFKRRRPCVGRSAKQLKRAGIKTSGRMVYELADGSTVEYDFGLAVIEFMGELTAGRVVFGPDDAAPILGATALESVGILVDPAHRTLKRMPAIPLK
jgi:hypothetical protein